MGASKMLDVDCCRHPGLPGQTGPLGVAVRHAGRPSRPTHDLTLLKDFGLGGGRGQLQIIVGAFNIFNQAYPTYNIGFNDLDLTLQTECNVHVNGVSNSAGGTVDNVCDPAGGFRFTQTTIDNSAR